MSTQPSATSISSVAATKPVLGKFNKEEVRYLKECLPKYIAVINQGPTKKGDKGEWVVEHIVPDFKSHFGYSLDGDGASVESISMVCSVHFPMLTPILTDQIQRLKCWFLNNGKLGATTKSTMVRLAKKPRAKNVLDVFVKENRDAIVEKTRHLSQNEGPKALGKTLSTWKQAQQAMFDALDPDTKARYESQAAELNKRLNSPPDVKEIYACTIF